MDLFSLDYIISKYFYKSLRLGDAWDSAMTLGPGIVLVFVEPEDRSAVFLIDALNADEDVARAAREYVDKCEAVPGVGVPFVRYAEFADRRQRLEIMDFIGHYLPGDRSP